MKDLALLAASIYAVASLALSDSSASDYHSRSHFKPRFGVSPHHVVLPPCDSPKTDLPYWKGSFVDPLGSKICFTMVGTDPAAGDKVTTIPVYIIPIRMVYGSQNGHKVLDPNKQVVANGLTVTQNTLASPIFVADYDFVVGKAHAGQTQYGDAFQRANFWSDVSKNLGYHVLLASPTILAEQDISVPPNEGCYGCDPRVPRYIGTMDLEAFDDQLKALIQGFGQISSGALPIFLTYNLYLTDGDNCCEGGHHGIVLDSGNKAQTYIYSTYVDKAGAFAQDVSAMSHEVGEWLDDPFLNNQVTCNDPLLKGLLEVGDPLEDEKLPAFGDYPYKLNGFTYNLQSLVFRGYFGAPAKFSANGWLSFKGPQDQVGVCSHFATVDPPRTSSTSINAINRGGAIAGTYTRDGVSRAFVRSVDGSYIGFGVNNSNTWNVDMNDDGVMAGWVLDSDGDAFVRSVDGSISTFVVSGATATFPAKINNQGTVAGHYTDGNNDYHAFIRGPDGTITKFNVHGATGTSVVSINDNGVAAGSYYKADRLLHGFVRSADGTISTYDVPGANGAVPQAMNVAGTITGYYVSDRVHGFIRNVDGTFISFDPSNSTGTFPYAINKDGWITGIFYANSAAHNFLRSPSGELESFDIPGSIQSVASGINAAGEITGYFEAEDGSSHGFVGSP